MKREPSHTSSTEARPIAIPAAVRRLLAVEASCDPRTIDRALRGEPIRGLAGDRARAVLVKVAGLLQDNTQAHESKS